MPIIEGKSYPRVENGRILYAPEARKPEPTETPKPTGLNLNTATAAQLSKGITGVGNKTARDIIAHRKKRPFDSLADCANRLGGVSISQLEAAGAIA
jgi:DNA uptake protein ComE-like DNA-binding protein